MLAAETERVALLEYKVWAVVLEYRALEEISVLLALAMVGFFALSANLVADSSVEVATEQMTAEVWMLSD